MKIEWNKVTWYSKIVALALFVILPIMAFWFGIGYGVLAGKIEAEAGPSMVTFSQPMAPATGAEYYKNVSEWQTIQNSTGGFSIAYPIDFSAGEYDLLTSSTDWSLLNPSGASGNLFFTLAIPPSFEPQTNFADAKLTVGRTGDRTAIAQCVTPDKSELNNAATSTVAVGNAVFTVLRFTGLGAGNIYETTSYRALHAGQCYAIEYTIHSSQILNYPAEYHLHPFDEKILTDLLDRIAGTFRFN